VQKTPSVRRRTPKVRRNNDTVVVARDVHYEENAAAAFVVLVRKPNGRNDVNVTFGRNFEFKRLLRDEKRNTERIPRGLYFRVKYIVGKREVTRPFEKLEIPTGRYVFFTKRP